MFKLLKMFRFFKNKKGNETKNHKKTMKQKTEKKNARKNQTKRERKPTYRRIDGPTQYRAHAGGAGIALANGRRIGFAAGSP
jgi:hypothetical protein